MEAAPPDRGRLRQRRPPARHRVGLDPGRAGSLRAPRARVHAGRQARAGRHLGRDRRRRPRAAAGGAGARRRADRGAQRARGRRARARGRGDARRPRAAARAAASGGPRSASSRTRRSSSSAARSRSSASRIASTSSSAPTKSRRRSRRRIPTWRPAAGSASRPGPDVVALEDSPTGVAAARAAGLTVIGIPSIEGVALDEAHHIAESACSTRSSPACLVL